MHGYAFTPAFVDPAVGGFDFTPPAGVAGVPLSDSYGSQIGAQGVPPASEIWTRYAVTVIGSSPVPPNINVSGASDGRDDSYWWSSNYNTNGWVTFDLESPKPINLFVLDVFGHYDPRNVRGYSIQVSNDNVTYQTVLAGNNPDDEGSSYKYLLASPVTARYVRFNMLSSFGASTLLFPDFAIGVLTPTLASPVRAVDCRSHLHRQHDRRRRGHHRHKCRRQWHKPWGSARPR
jgi:hypothetical protein